ncbi:MAG: ATP-dependent helicase [Bdellovibrionales bacterium]
MNLPVQASVHVPEVAQGITVPPALQPWLADLNPPQQQAVLTLQGPLLVLSGAGTGKTKVLTTRLAHILMGGYATPQQVLTVTFTNKAAREMSHRAEAILGRPTAGMWLGTFHSLSVRILRRWAERVGLKSNFTILDEDDQLRLIKQLVEAMGLDEKKNPARLLASVIDGWKNKALGPDQVGKYDAGSLLNGKMADLYRDYQQRLLSLNACDFGDLLLHTLVLLRDHEDVRTHYQQQFKYILVDEYQDTNVAQYLWLRLLAQGKEGGHKNICCVGDDDQSIFSWRGAEVGNILKFERDFEGAQVIRLEQNYRSTAHILAAASGVIANNRDRLGKTLWTAADEGDKVRVRSLWDGDDEARWVGEEIEALQRKRVDLNNIAILVRAGFQTRAFEDRFIQLGIPYRVLSGMRFYETQECRDALAYFRTICVPEDDLAFDRIINVPKRGVGEASVQKLRVLARHQGRPLYVVTEDIIETDELPSRTRTPLRELVRNFQRWRSLQQSISHVDLARMVLEESGYTAMWQQDKTPQAQGRLENLKELVNAMAEFESLPAFLEHVALVMDAAKDNDTPMVTLMTLHAAKGLEFGYVFLPGWEEDIFPSKRTLDESGSAGLEEERRLAYVGLTRARQQAYVSFASQRRVYGNTVYALPSRFVAEIPADNRIDEKDPGMYAAPSAAYRGQQGSFSNAYASRSFEPPAASKSVLLEGQVRELVYETEEGDTIFTPGARVFHDKFGYGTVVAKRTGMLEVKFDTSGLKKVADSFVQKA